MVSDKDFPKFAENFAVNLEIEMPSVVFLTFGFGRETRTFTLPKEIFEMVIKMYPNANHKFLKKLDRETRREK